MTDDERAYEIRNLLWEHAHPTLRGMDRERIAKLTEQILRIATDRRLWTKWSGDRETLAERAAEIWIPMEDLREALNALPGPQICGICGCRANSTSSSGSSVCRRKATIAASSSGIRYRRSGLLRTHLAVFNARPLTPLQDRLRVDPKALGKRRDRGFRSL